MAYSVTHDALLIGHEDWVCGVAWQPKIKENGAWVQPKCLISASMDKSLMIWKPEEETGIWVNVMRVGDVGGENALGFFDAQFGPDGQSILGHGFNGTLRLWKMLHEAEGLRNLFRIFNRGGVTQTFFPLSQVKSGKHRFAAGATLARFRTVPGTQALAI